MWTPPWRKVPVPSARQIYVNEPLPASRFDNKGRLTTNYTSNEIKTFKYTWWTFLPKNLYEQVSRVRR